MTVILILGPETFVGGEVPCSSGTHGPHAACELGHVVQLRSEEAPASRRELLGLARGQEPVDRRCPRGALEAVPDEHPVDVLRALLRAADQGHVIAHHHRDHAGEQRVVGAAEDEGVHTGCDQRIQVLVRRRLQLRPAGDAFLDELHEPRTGLRRQGDVGCRREGVLVGERVGSCAGADDADSAAPGGGNRPAGGGQDHLDHGDVVPLAGVTEHRGAGRVAGDHECLHALVDEVVEALEGVLADLGDRLGAIGLPGGVAEVDHCLVGQLVHDGTSDGEPTEARVENPDRRVSHSRQG